MKQSRASLCYAFLYAVPFLAAALTAVRPLRVPGIHQTIGLVHFALICVALWSLGAPVFRTGAVQRKRFALSGALLLAPFAFFALFWVGVGPPWEATPTENRMRYLVLLVGSMCVASGFVVLKEAVCEAGEHLYSSLGFATNIFAGASYLVWLAFQIGLYVVLVRDGEWPPALLSMSDVFDMLLFIACALTYLTVAAYAVSLGRTGWLSRRGAKVFVLSNLVALTLLSLRGLSFPDPNASDAPWYFQPGFIAGVPAVPWIMPSLIGVAIMRRAGRAAR